MLSLPQTPLNVFDWLPAHLRPRQRTNTTQLTKFVRQNVTMDLTSPPESSNFSQFVILTLPQGSNWSSGVHWHESHTEYLEVLQGVACIFLNGKTNLVSPFDGVTIVPSFARHEWHRATRIDLESYHFYLSSFAKLSNDNASSASFDRDFEIEISKTLSTPLIMKTSFTPIGEEKEIFFRNLNSIIMEEKVQSWPDWVWGLWISWQLWVVLGALDNFPVLLEGALGRILGKTGEVWITHLILSVAAFLGTRFGMRSTYDEYTPERLRRIFMPLTIADIILRNISSDKELPDR